MSYYWNKEIDEGMKETAIKEFKLLNSPLKFVINNKKFIAKYRNHLISYPKYDITEKEFLAVVNKWQKSVDKNVQMTIDSFVNPIYKEVFGRPEYW